MTDYHVRATAISIETVDRAIDMFAEVSANKYCLTMANSRFQKLIRSAYDRGNLRQITLAALVHLPRWAIATVGLGLTLFDGIKAEQFGAAAPLWNLLHQPAAFDLTRGKLIVLYPLIPWVGVMATGCTGTAVKRETRVRQLFTIGALITIGFVFLRATNLYGDPAPWAVQNGVVATVLSFINCEKYPPSLLFLAMTHQSRRSPE
jgi:uncharacterized membrane protein